jgi:hypothetical protein
VFLEQTEKKTSQLLQSRPRDCGSTSGVSDSWNFFAGLQFSKEIRVTVSLVESGTCSAPPSGEITHKNTGWCFELSEEVLSLWNKWVEAWSVSL